jgi:hypothetical protein
VYVYLLQESAGGVTGLQESGSAGALAPGSSSLLQKILTPAPQEFDSGSMRKSKGFPYSYYSYYSPDFFSVVKLRIIDFLLFFMFHSSKPGSF